MAGGVVANATTELELWRVEAGNVADAAASSAFCLNAPHVLAQLAGREPFAIVEVRESTPAAALRVLVAFGVIARDREARRAWCPDVRDPARGLADALDAPAFDLAHVAAFDGRARPPRPLWSVLADQLHAERDLSAFDAPFRALTAAPTERDWLALLPRAAPTLILLHELAAHLAALAVRPITRPSAADVATASLASLLAAVARMPNACVVQSAISSRRP